MRTLTIDDNWKDWKFGDTDAVMTFTALDDDQTPDFTGKTLTFKIADTTALTPNSPNDYVASAAGYVENNKVVLKTEDVKALTPGTYSVELWVLNSLTQKNAVYPSKGFAFFTIEENTMKVSDITNVPSKTLEAIWAELVQRVDALKQGEQGEPGQTPKLVIGTVTKVGSDQQPSVSLIPTANDPNTYMVNFQIPQGEQGEQGDPGAPGTPGIQGLPGKDGLTPSIDSATKHWMIGNTDTEIVAEGQPGKTPVKGTDYWNDADKQEIQAEGQKYIESTLAKISLEPEAFENEAALKAKYPNGKSGIMVTVDTGHKWLWANSTWTDAGVYQSVGIADESITMEKTFGIVTRSGNYYDYKRVTRGKKLDITTGLEVSNASYAVSDYEPVLGLSGNYYATINGANACFYSKDKTFLTGVENVKFSNGRKIPDGAYWQRISVVDSTYQDDMLAITKTQLTADPVYTEYIKKIIGLRTQADYIDNPNRVIDRITDKYLSVNKLSDLSFAYNVFNPKALVNEEVNTDGTFTASTLKKRTPFLPIKAGDYYGSNNSLTAYFYDENFNFVYMQDNTSFGATRSVPTTYTTVRFVVFCSTINNITWVDSDGNPNMAVISASPIGSSTPPYTPFGYKIGNELIATKNDKTNVSFLSPKYVYTVYNDLNPARQIGARMYLDHFFTFVSDDNNAIFRENKKDWWPLVAPNNNNNLVKTEIAKTNYIDSDKYVSKKISVTQRSVKASAGSTAPVRILQIGDSMTYSVPSSGPFGGSYPSWGYIKKLFELDKIDNGDEGFDVELMGTNPNVEIPINYSGVTKTVRAGAEGFGGWGLTTAMYHPTRIDPSQASWDLLGLGNGSGTDYTGSQVQKDLIRTTPQYGVAGAFNPFYDSSVTSGVPFSILKYLEKFRTRLDDGTKLTLGHPQLGTSITTQEQIDNWYIATPTHIILQHGRNDEPYINAFNTAAQAFITKVKEELPSVKIGFAIPADAVGTMFPSKYPNVLNISGEGMDRIVNRSGSYGIANVLLTNYSNMEVDGVYLVPNYFVGATGLGINLREIENMDSDDKTYALDLGADYSHPNFKFCHRAWAYQMYSWIKYTLA